MMKFSKILLLAILVLIISCKNDDSVEIEASEENDEQTDMTDLSDKEIVDNVRKVEYQDQNDFKFGDASSWDENTVLADGIVSREGEPGSWAKIEILNIFGFEIDPGKGEYVQVIPMVEGIPSLALQVTKTQGMDDINPGIIDWYSVELEEVRNKSYFDADAVEGRREEYPFNVFVIYPGVSTARYLPVKRIQLTDLPEEVSLEVISGALDIDNDEKPDAIICDFCCSDSTTSENCDYYCSANYIKVSGAWHKVYDGSPM